MSLARSRSDAAFMDQDRLEQDRSRLAEAERRQRLLSDVSRELLDYVGPDEIEPLRRIVRRVSESLSNDWCAFALVQPDGTLKNVVAFHPDPRQRELEKKLSALLPPRRWDEPPAERNALLARGPVVAAEITDEMLRAAAPSEEAFLILGDIGPTSAVVAPMFDGAQPLGTLLLASVGTGRRYSGDDVDFAFTLEGRAALAVRNARLVRELAAERDRQRLERLEADRRFAELRAVFDWDPNGIALFDTDGVLRMASRQIEEIFGLPVRAMYGLGFEEIYRRKLAQAAPADREAMLARVRAIFANRDATSRDDVELERPRHRWLTRNSVPVRSVDGEYLGRLVVYMDVTEQRELDRQRADFLTVAAHELRTPLTPLSMYLQSIDRRVARGQAVDGELMTKARRQVDRLGKLVEDLLDVSRLESRRMHLASCDVEMNELADEVVADFRGQTRSQAGIRNPVQTTLPYWTLVSAECYRVWRARGTRSRPATPRPCPRPDPGLHVSENAVLPTGELAVGRHGLDPPAPDAAPYRPAAPLRTPAAAGGVSCLRLHPSTPGHPRPNPDRARTPRPDRSL